MGKIAITMDDMMKESVVGVGLMLKDVLVGEQFFTTT